MFVYKLLYKKYKKHYYKIVNFTKNDKKMNFSLKNFFCLLNKNLNNEKKKKFISDDKFPLVIFLIFEKTQIFYWKSNILKKNHTICFLKSDCIGPLASILRFELSLSDSQLLEYTGYDFSKKPFDFNLFKNNNELINEKKFFLFFNSNKKFLSCNFYFFYIKQRITFFFSINNNSILSIENYFSNSNWLEREISEMYGIIFNNKKDSRNLLLDYSVIYNPMLKTFPSTGSKEIFFNNLKKNVIYSSNLAVEL